LLIKCIMFMLKQYCNTFNIITITNIINIIINIDELELFSLDIEFEFDPEFKTKHAATSNNSIIIAIGLNKKLLITL